MRHAETVTFGGSGLDRAAELRGDAATLDDWIAAGKAETLVSWRGKPLVNGLEQGAPGAARLVRLAMDHPVLMQSVAPPVLLGRDAGRMVFIHDISGWVPEGLDDAALGQFVDLSEQRHPDLPEDCVFAELRRVMTWLDVRDAELAATGKAILGWHGTHRFCARCGAESRMEQSGWTRICGACGGQHFPRTDPVVIMLITRGNRVLMGRSHGWPEGMYSLLAGFVEPGETIEAAVRREVLEETGVRVGEVGYLASQPWAFPASLMIGCRGEALSDEIIIDPVEIDDALWLSREDIMQAFAGEHPFLSPARKGAIAHFLLRNWLADTLV